MLCGESVCVLSLFSGFSQASGRKYRSILKSGTNVGGRRRVIKAGRKIRRLFLYGYGKDKLRRRFPSDFLRIRRAKGARLKYIVKNSCLNWQNIVKYVCLDGHIVSK